MLRRTLRRFPRLLRAATWALFGLKAWARSVLSQNPTRVAVTHPALLKVRGLQALTGIAWVWSPFGLPARATAVLGWGQKKTGARAIALGHASGLPTLLAEEAFLKGARRDQPALQLLLDGSGGVHYDPARPSCIDAALDRADTPAVRARAEQAIATIRAHGVSKLQNKRDPRALPDRPFVLVVDQVAGDASLAPSKATPERFQLMLDATRRTWPDHLVVVRTHPDLHDRGKGGHFSHLASGDGLLVHDGNDHPSAWLQAADHVVVMSSQMGFEALIHGTPVTCWGTPFYAARGLTRDMGAQPGYQRRACDLVQLVGAACILAPTSFHPATWEVGEAEDVLEHLVAHRTALRADPEEAVAVGFSPRKRRMLARFMPHTRWVEADRATPHTGVVAWGATALPPALRGRPLWRVEDGFLRSKGLGAALVPALSWTIDGTGGIFYDPRQPSALSEAAMDYTGTPEQTGTVARLRARLLASGATKYNLAEHPPTFDAAGRATVLVVGQVEQDASIKAGCGAIRTNADLLRAARAAWPDAFLVYRPHPDVVSGLRPGAWQADGALADAVEPHAGTLALIDTCDRVAVMTSQMGFEALLRGKPVTCFGTPFYAGWGLTDDRGPTAIGRAPRPLDALLWAAYVATPRYVSPRTGKLIGWEGALHLLARTPTAKPIGRWRRIKARLADAWRRRAG